ncbi:terpene synthase family protein [Streptomyces klenkii]
MLPSDISQALPRYPWPAAVHPQTDKIRQSLEEAIPQYMEEYPGDQVSRYTNMHLEQVAATTSPAGEFDRVWPMALFVLYAVAADDYYEFARPEEQLRVGRHVHRLTLGSLPSADDHGILRLAADIGRDLRSMTTFEHVHRYAQGLRRFHDGIGREALYRHAKVIPPLEECLEIRALTIGLEPMHAILELILEQPLPTAVAEHPVIVRLRQLVSYMAAFQNDIVNMIADQDGERVHQGDVISTVLAAQHHMSLTPNQAYEYVLQRNEQAVGEFEFLRKNLPDFGPGASPAAEYAQLIASAVAGWNQWYSKTPRYRADGRPMPYWNQ